MEKLNIEELLKDCPKGMELDSTIFENLEFDHIDKNNEAYPIICRVKTSYGYYNIHTFTEYGCYQTANYSKCVIFPKGKTTWEGFQRPFKDGDIITTEYDSICIYKGIHKNYKEPSCDYYCGFRQYDGELIISSGGGSHFGLISKCKFATEKEKQRLFDAIKENGYKWNAETKTLEKLIVPKFKVGDTIRYKRGNKAKLRIESIKQKEEFYHTHDYGRVYFKHQDDWELVPNKFDITTLKPFESRVLVRDKDTDEWRGHFFSHYNNNYDRPYICIGVEEINEYEQCIPFEENKHLLGTTNDCDEFYKTWK